MKNRRRSNRSNNSTNREEKEEEKEKKSRITKKIEVNRGTLGRLSSCFSVCVCAHRHRIIKCNII